MSESGRTPSLLRFYINFIFNCNANICWLAGNFCRKFIFSFGFLLGFFVFFFSKFHMKYFYPASKVAGCPDPILLQFRLSFCNLIQCFIKESLPLFFCLFFSASFSPPLFLCLFFSLTFSPVYSLTFFPPFSLSLYLSLSPSCSLPPSLSLFHPTFSLAFPPLSFLRSFVPSLSFECSDFAVPAAIIYF